MWIFYLVLLSDWPVDLDLDSGTSVCHSGRRPLLCISVAGHAAPSSVSHSVKNLILISELCLVLLLNIHRQSFNMVLFVLFAPADPVDLDICYAILEVDATSSS